MIQRVSTTEGRRLLQAQAKKHHKSVKRFDWADHLSGQIKAMHMPEPVREYQPFMDRRFRLDLAYPERKLFIECDGGEWTHGRHGRGKGMQADCIKWNLLTSAGWMGYRFVGSQVKSGSAVMFLELVLKGIA